MAAMFLAKRGTINIYRGSSLHRDYNSARSVADRASIITSSRFFSSDGNNETEKSKQNAMGTTTDGKAPNVTMSHATDTAKDGLKQTIDVTIDESGDVSKPEKSAESEEGSEENVAVGEDGTVKGQNQSAG